MIHVFVGVYSPFGRASKLGAPPFRFEMIGENAQFPHHQIKIIEISLIVRMFHTILADIPVCLHLIVLL